LWGELDQRTRVREPANQYNQTQCHHEHTRTRRHARGPGV